MNKILIPINTMHDAEPAVEFVLSEAANDPEVECHLLHVQPPVPIGLSAYMDRKEIEALEAMQAERTLQPVCEALNVAYIPCIMTFGAGSLDQVLADYAKKHQCNSIVMGSGRKGILGAILDKVIAKKVYRLTRIPVRLV